MSEAIILWQALYAPGHDTCRLIRLDDGWRLCGMAVFLQDSQPCAVSYDVRCDGSWHTRSAHVAGSLGAMPLDFRIANHAGRWLLDDVEQPQLAGCIDVDVGFTPATNLLPLRRYALDIGQHTPAPAAYLTFPELRMERLVQTYGRLDATRYAYTSPGYDYDDVLEVNETGFVLDYPGLWKAVMVA